MENINRADVQTNASAKRAIAGISAIADPKSCQFCNSQKISAIGHLFDSYEGGSMGEGIPFWISSKVYLSRGIWKTVIFLICGS